MNKITLSCHILFLCFVLFSCGNNGVKKSLDPNGAFTKDGLFYRTFLNQDLQKNPTLMLVLHGDSPFNDPSYQYEMAEILSKNNNVIAVGILRPGYRDRKGNISDGIRGNTTGDNYTKEVNDAIVELTKELVQKYEPTKVILVGHSGGAAISANLISTNPDTYHAAILVSCPCDLPKWRAHMKTLQPEFDLWDEEVSSLSPIELVELLADRNQLVIVHGTNDDVVPYGIIESYEKVLHGLNKNFELVGVQGGGHEIFFEQVVFEKITTLIAEY